MLGKAWDMAKEGTTIKKLTAMAEKEGSTPGRILRTLRRGKNKRGFSWKVEENKGSIRIYNIKKGK